MAKNIGARKASFPRVVCTAPSWNWTPGCSSPIPYPVTYDLNSSNNVSYDTMYNGDNAFMMQSHSSNVTGDEAGKNGGVKSGTVTAEAEPIEHSSSVRVNKRKAVRCFDKFYMNHKNTTGILICTPPPQQGHITDKGKIDCGKCKKMCTNAPHISPTPGSCEYYKKRYESFIDRFADCIMCGNYSPPNYYMNYGYKYCRRFKYDTMPILSKEGQKWLLRTLKRLQVSLEESLKHTNECDSDAVRKKAFDSHPDAYNPEEMSHLPASDLWKIAKTPDFGEWFGTGSGLTWKQAAETGGRVVGNWAINGYEAAEKAAESVLEDLTDIFEHVGRY